MSEWKSRVTTHLRSAQGWLSKAEQSFDEQKDIRGELNLMLAQAELKRALQEYRGSVLLICHEPEFYTDVVSQVWDCTKWTTRII